MIITFHKACKNAKTLLPAGKYNMAVRVFGECTYNNNNILGIFSVARCLIERLPNDVVIVGIDNSRFIDSPERGFDIELEFTPVVCKEQPKAW